MNDSDIHRWHMERTGRDADYYERDDDEETISQDYIDYVETYMEDR